MRELEPRREGTGGGPSDFFLIVAVAVLLLSTGLIAWAVTVFWMRRTLASRWWPAGAAVGMGATMVALGAPGSTLARLAAATAGVEVSAWTVTGVLAAAGLLAGRVALATAPVAVPLGLAAAALTPPPDEGMPGSPSPASRRRDARRAKREIARVETLAATPAPTALEPTSPVLGVVAGEGDLPPGWVQGKYLTLPTRAAGLPRLVIGRPGQGKSVYLCREVELAGHDHRQAVVVDCKGEPGFAGEVEAAYRAGWEASPIGDSPTVHRWPDEPLNAWTGGPAAVANRLLSVWTFDVAALWYREIVALALRLALHAPGDPVTSSSALLERVQPGALAELWKGHPRETALVASLGNKLDDVSIRLANLLSALGGLLDGPRAIGGADLTILSLPVMGAEHDAASVLRVALADLAHYVVSRKAPGRQLLAVVDEFSAVPGGREHALHLTERGRSAGAATVLAVQSARGLGDDDEADRLIGAVGAVVLFGTAEPERILKLAGTVQTSRHTTSLGNDGITRETYSEAMEYRVDANDVRALTPGYAYILASGRAQRIKVIRPRAGDGPRPAGAADGNPAPGDGPARAVASRELPPPVQPRQPRPLGPSASGVDPAGRSSVRRYRPPRAGGEAAPPVDRDHQGGGDAIERSGV